MQIKDRQRFLTILVIGGISLLVVDQLVRPPLMKFWDSRADEIKTLRNEVKHGESLKRSKDSIRAQWAEIQAATLSNNTSVAEQQLYKGIDRWSEVSGVTISSITPQSKQPSDDYKTIECRVDASGSIDRVCQFLYELEMDPMALKLQGIELTASDGTGQTIGLGVQISGLVLTPKGK